MIWYKKWTLMKLLKLLDLTRAEKILLVWPSQATTNIWYQINVKRIRNNSA